MPTLCHQHHDDPATQPRDGCEQTGARHDLRHGLHSALSAHGLHVTVSLTIAPPVQLPGVSCSCCRCPQCPRAPVNHVSPAPRFADAADAGVQTTATARQQQAIDRILQFERVQRRAADSMDGVGELCARANKNRFLDLL